MHGVEFILSILAGLCFGGMTSATAVVFFARIFHREKLADDIAGTLSNVTWALRMGGGLPEYARIRTN